MGRGIPIITIRHPEAPRRDGFLEEHQDLVLPTSAGPRSGEYLVAQKVLEILVRDPRTNAVGVRALAEAFANSGSYDAARRWYGLLTQQASIESPQLRRLEQAVQTNSQVSNAVYGGPSSSRRIPDLIAELVQRHEPKSFVAVEDEEPF